MRRLALMLACCGLFQLLTPTPAHAWYEWIDQLSGPGPFKGFQFDLRLVCFDDPVPRPIPKNDPNATSQERATEQSVLADDAAERAKRSAIGIEASCPADKNGVRKLSSVGIDFRVLSADAEPAYAGNNDIKLVTIGPSFSRSIISKPKYNIVDVGAGGGVYWFSSKGFRSFSGVILEPLRIDLHAPRGGEQNVLRAIANSFVLRTGMIVFPNGFDPNAFAGTRQTATRLRAEKLFTWGIYADITPFIRWAESR